MALINVDHHHHQQSNLKHFCKICKKGFGCGRALGGHMRAHGIGDESWHVEDEEEEDDQASDWEERLVNGPNKRMYALRTNPNRLKSCRVCENCGKEFLSWKSFLEHGKCTSDAESPVSSPGFDGDGDEDVSRRGCEEDLANCLMMLSNAAVDPLIGGSAEPEESCASASRDEERRTNHMMNNFITPLSYRVPTTTTTTINVDNNKAKGVIPKGLFECKACKKVFNSHQALGGHRASHKKVKGCFASRLDHPRGGGDDDDDVITHEEFLPTKSNSTLQYHHHHHHHGPNLLMAPSSSSKKKPKVHECSICHRTFSSGQALGGHKRCHWITSNAPDTSALTTRFQQFHQEHVNNQIPKFDNNNNSELLDLKLDLNLPARELSTEIYLQPWVGGTKEKDGDNSQCYKNSNNMNTNNASMVNVEDEADSKVKLAKLSELKDMNMGGSSSPWLQVGIGSGGTVGADS
ncbi:zinc finger protein ZAT1 [Senna tora]|uniref:Zinc finger protein ZAT1 n=1 Tax=Senna tora TaxID=362788 RepID=A0A834XI66_9FABA|nr:zinc finger protein ZAT1 [Senna tora]